MVLLSPGILKIINIFGIPGFPGVPGVPEVPGVPGVPGSLHGGVPPGPAERFSDIRTRQALVNFGFWPRR